MTDTEPVRYSVKAAARVLSLDPNYVYQLIADGHITGHHPNGKGPGKRVYLDAGEVHAYAKGGSDAARQYRQIQKLHAPELGGEG